MFKARGVGHVHSIARFDNGDVVLCGQDVGAWLVVVSPSSQIALNTTVERPLDGATETCSAVLAHDAQQTVLIGDTNSHAMLPGDWSPPSKRPLPPYVGTPTAAMFAVVSDKGATTTKRVYGNFRRFYQNTFGQGLPVQDGFVALGAYAERHPSNSISGERHVPVIWMVKLKHNGDLDWEYRLREDAGDLAQAPGGPGLSDIVRLADGSFVFATNVLRPRVITEEGESRLTTLPEFVPRPERSALVVKVDSSGKEVARAPIARVLRPQLMKSASGMLLVGNYSEEGRRHVERLQVLELDDSLNVRRSATADLKGDEFLMSGATASADGAYVIGNYVRVAPGASEFGEGVIAEVTREGRFRVIQRFGGGWSMERIVSIPPGQVLVARSKQGIVQLGTFRATK